MNSRVQSHTAPAPSLLSANAGFVGSGANDGEVVAVVVVVVVEVVVVVAVVVVDVVDVFVVVVVVVVVVGSW